MNVRRAEVIASEQQAVDHAYRCYADQMHGIQALAAAPAAASGKDSIALAGDLRRQAEELDLNGESLVVMRIDTAGSGADTKPCTWYVGRRRVYDSNKDLVVIPWTNPAAKHWLTQLPGQPGEVRLRRRLQCRQDRVEDYIDELRPPEDDSVEAEAARDEAPTAASYNQWEDLFLTELDRSRDLYMRDIVETIRREQLLLVSDERSGVLVVQGGPGTGKTAVALHRVTWLIDNDHLAAEQVLVVGPHQTFLDYVSKVLPTLGSNGVTAVEISRIFEGEVRGADSLSARRVKSDERMAKVLRRALEERIRPPAMTETDSPTMCSVQFDGIELRVPAADVAQALTDARVGRGTFQARRRGFVEQVGLLFVRAYELRMARRIAGGERDRQIRRAPELVSLIEGIWPQASAPEILRRLLHDPAYLNGCADGILDVQEQEALRRQQAERVSDEPWSLEDLVCLEELRFLLGADRPRRYQHLVIDEAQDVTPMQARALVRRCPSRSMTLVGDLAQGTGSHGYTQWSRLASILSGKEGWHQEELAIGYRVPREVMDFAAPLARTIASATAFPESIRQGGEDAVTVLPCPPWQLLDTAIQRAAALSRTVGTGTDDEQRPRSIALLVPDDADWIGEVRNRIEALTGLPAEPSETIRVLPAGLAKGMEFDHVVVIEPAEIAAREPAGLHQLYVALTRCTQTLSVVHAAPLPSQLLAARPSPEDEVSGQVCTRFHADGQRCTNPTANGDGWCRWKECGGFRSSTVLDGPRLHRYLTVPFEADTNVQLSLTPDESSGISVTRAVLTEFCNRHGGTPVEAEAEVRLMLPKFLADARQSRQSDGYWLLDLAGFRLVISPDSSAVTAYRTVHAERSYAQIEAGVPSRAGRSSRQAGRPPFGVKHEATDQVVDEVTLRNGAVQDAYLTSTVTSQFARQVPETQELDNSEFETLMRQALAADLREGELRRHERDYRVTGERFTWSITLDGRVVKYLRPKTVGDESDGRLESKAPVGQWLTGHVTGQAPDGHWLVDVPVFDTDTVFILQRRVGSAAPETGAEGRFWITGYRAGTVLVSADDFGRIPFSQATRARYLAAVAVNSQASEVAKEELADRYSDLKGLASRSLRKDQADWFLAWELLGRPSRQLLASLQRLAMAGRQAVLSGETDELATVHEQFEQAGWDSRLAAAHRQLKEAENAELDTSSSEETEAARITDAAGAAEEEALPPTVFLSSLLSGLARQDREDNVHEAVRFQLMSDLFRAQRRPVQSEVIDAAGSGPLGTVLFEVLRAGAGTYEDLRQGVLRIQEIAAVSETAPQRLCLVLPEPPGDRWAVEFLSARFGVSMIWWDNDAWAGDLSIL